MKYIFSLLLIFSFNLSFSQMTVSEMIKVSKMDMDTFKAHAASKGFIFHETIKNDDFYGNTFLKGQEPYTKWYKYLSLYTKYLNEGNVLCYQTTDRMELKNIRNQVKYLGFNLISTSSSSENFDGSKSYFKEDVYDGHTKQVYANDNCEIRIYTYFGHYEIKISHH